MDCVLMGEEHDLKQNTLLHQQTNWFKNCYNAATKLTKLLIYYESDIMPKKSSKFFFANSFFGYYILNCI